MHTATLTDPCLPQDELYLTCMEMFLNATFVLVYCSEKGKGKSLRALRMAVILPEGWCSFNSGNTARSGMNGALNLLEPDPCPTDTLEYRTTMAVIRLCNTPLWRAQATTRPPTARWSSATR